MSISIKNAYSRFDGLDGQPLDDGYIYIGELGQNPKAKPVTVYWDSAMQDEALQPIRTIGGYPARNGSASNVFSAATYSILVEDKNNNLVMSELNGVGDNLSDIAHRGTYMAYDGSNPDAILLTSVSTGAVDALVVGQCYRFRATTTNTGAATINIDGLGAVACKTEQGNALPAGFISTTLPTKAFYDGTNLIIEQQFFNLEPYTYEVTGSAVTTIDFSGLDFVADGGKYEIILDWVFNGASATAANMFINGDATLANYTTQILSADDTTVSGSRATNANIARNIGTNGTTSLSVIDLSLVGSTTPKAQWVGQSKREEGSSTLMVSLASNYAISVTNITQITFTTTVALGFGVGTKIKIKRG